MISRYRAKLSDGEYKRYEYLMQSIAYLNASQKQELAYLHAKAEGRLTEPRSKQTSAQTQVTQAETKSVAEPESEMDSFRPTKPASRQTTQPPLKNKQTKTKQTKTRQTGSRQAQGQTAPLTDRERKILTQKAKKVKKTKKKSRIGCFFALLFWGILATVIVMAVMFFKGVYGVTGGTSNLKPAATEYFDGQQTRDGINILILGSDKRVTEDSTDARTDTIMVMNIGNSDGKVKLVSFMRDTLVNIEGYSEPYTYDIKINTAFNLGEQENNRGAEFMRQTLKDNFDLDIQYYAMVDFETFAIAVDTLFPDGVYMDAKFSTIEGEVVSSVEVPDDVGFGSTGELYQTIAVGPQRMDGKTLLNYARFRSDDEGDAGRVRRQQEVLQAVLTQIKDPTKLFTGSEAIGKLYALTSTNISFSFILQNGLAGLTASQEGIERLTIPEQGDWIDTYDRYGGEGLLIDFESYKQELTNLGLR